MSDKAKMPEALPKDKRTHRALDVAHDLRRGIRMPHHAKVIEELAEAFERLRNEEAIRQELLVRFRQDSDQYLFGLEVGEKNERARCLQLATLMMQAMAAHPYLYAPILNECKRMMSCIEDGTIPWQMEGRDDRG